MLESRNQLVAHVDIPSSDEVKQRQEAPAGVESQRTRLGFNAVFGSYGRLTSSLKVWVLDLHHSAPTSPGFRVGQPAISPEWSQSIPLALWEVTPWDMHGARQRHLVEYVARECSIVPVGFCCLGRASQRVV